MQNINEYQHIRLKKFSLNENNIIFCNSDDIDTLFALLKKSKFKNIQLITHQSDRSITKKIYNKKPSCISKWYSTNIAEDSDNLISIPLGLANLHPKNINLNNFKNLTLNHDSYFNNLSKSSKLYLNFQISTNYGVRAMLYKKFENKNWVIAHRPNEDIKNYSNNLKKYKYILCPEGNGYDTHRVWEALYSGSVPVTKHKKALKYAEDLPIIFIKDYQHLNIENIDSVFEELKKQSSNLEKLTFEYWSELIFDFGKIKNNNNELYFENKFIIFLESRNKKIKKFNSKFKIIRYYFWKIRLKLT